MSSLAVQIPQKGGFTLVVAALLFTVSPVAADEGPAQFLWSIPADEGQIPVGFQPAVKIQAGYSDPFESTLFDAGGEELEHDWDTIGRSASGLNATLEPGSYTLSLQHLTPWDGSVDNELTFDFSVVSVDEWPNQETPEVASFTWTEGYRDADYYAPNGPTGADPIGPYIRIEIDPISPRPAYYRVEVDSETRQILEILHPESEIGEPLIYFISGTRSVDVVAVNFLNEAGPSAPSFSPESQDDYALGATSCSTTEGSTTSLVALALLSLLALRRRKTN